MQSGRGITRLLSLLVGILWLVGGCVAPDGLIVGGQVDAPVEEPLKTYLPLAETSLAAELVTLIPPRPILYFDLGPRGMEGVISAVDQDGASFGSIGVGIGQLLGWSHQGDHFAYLTAGYSGDFSRLAVATLGEEGNTIFESEAGEKVISWGRQSAWSSDDTQIALVLGNETDGRIVLVDIAGGETKGDFPLPPTISLPELAASGDPVFVKWSPDGQKLLLGLRQVIVLDVVTGTTQTLYDEPVFHMADHVEWLDGESLIYLDTVPYAPSHHPQLWRQRLGEEPVLLLTHDQMAMLGLDGALMYSMNLSPSGTYLAVAAVGRSSQGGAFGNTVITRFDMAAFEGKPGARAGMVPEAESFEMPAMITSLEWSADEQMLAFAMLSEQGLTIEVLPWSEGTSKSVVELAPADAGFGAFLMVSAFNLVSWTP